MPKSSNLIISNYFFLAFIMLGSVANLGVFSLKSHEIIPGFTNDSSCTPVSISLNTLNWVPSLSILQAKVAWGQFKRPANNYPV